MPRPCMEDSPISSCTGATGIITTCSSKCRCLYRTASSEKVSANNERMYIANSIALRPLME